MFRKILGLNLALMGLGVFSACVVDGSESGANAPIQTQTVTEIDKDNSYKRALGLFFDVQKIDDSIDASAGDSEDWRYIIVTQPGVITLKIGLDSPDKVTGEFNIQDAQGRSLRKVPIESKDKYYEISDISVAEGIYYFQFMITQGATTYTIGAEFKAQEAQPVLVADNTPPPEPPQPVAKPEKTEKTTKTTNTKSTKDKKDKTNKDKEPKTTEKKPEPVAEAPTQKVTGFISIITPKPDGSAEITIRDVGKNKGVEAGAVGTVDGTSMKLKTTQCFATSCRAVIQSADTKSIKQGANVVFKVKQ